MFEWLSKVKAYETTNLDKKNKLEQLLIENKIEYQLEIADLHTRNAFDALSVSQIPVKPKDVYTFYVDRKVKQTVIQLLKKM